MRISKVLAVFVVSAVWGGLRSSAWAAPTIDMLTDMAFTNGAAGVVEVQPILISDDTPSITAASDIRLIIPATFAMTWDTTDTSVEVLMSGTGVISATVTSYQNSSKTCVLDVTTNFAIGDRAVISGLSFTGWNAEKTANTLGLAWDGTNVAGASSNQFFTIGGAKLSSANNFSFKNGDTTPTLPNITITDSSAAPLITAASDIRLSIRNTALFGTAPTWDPTMTSITITGGASAKVSSALTGASFQNANRTLVIDVTANFAASDTITISGLRFATLGAAYNADSLELVVNGTNVPANTDVVAVDDKVFAIGPPAITMASVTTVSASAANATIGTITITDTTPSITAASDIRLIVMSTTSTGGTNTGRDNLNWTNGTTPSYTQPSTGRVSAAAIGATDTGNGAGKRLVLIDVTTSFAANDVLAIGGLQISNGTATATKLYIGLVIQGFTNASLSSAYGRVVSMVTEQNATGSGSSPRSGGGGSGACFLGTAGRTAVQ